MKFKRNIKYLLAFFIVLGIETIIAFFIRDAFIRPYVGDVLVVVVIYCFIRSFAELNTRLLPLYLFIFTVLVEIGQYFNLVELLGLSDYKIARIIIGATFDGKDILCYFAGCVGLFLYEQMKRSASEEGGRHIT